MARKYGLFINGNYVHANSWRAVPSSIDPSQLLAEVSQFRQGEDDPSLMEACLEGVSQTQMQIFQGFFPLEERLAFLERLKNRLTNQKENLARIIMQEVGKPITLARGEVDRAIETINWTLISAEKLLNKNGSYPSERSVPSESREAWKNYSGHWEHVPRGPLLAITPFNFPLNLIMHKLAPAIAAGCPVVLKPSPKATLTALCLTDYCHAEEMPPGMLNTFLCDDKATRTLIQDPRLSQISFTGSAHVGWELKKLTSKPFILELGGAAPVYIHKDANIEAAANTLAMSSIAYSGQVCISTQNIHIHPEVFDSFKGLLLKSLSKIPAGNPAQEDCFYGPVVDQDTLVRIQSLAKNLEHQGLKVESLRPLFSETETVNDVLFKSDEWKKNFHAPAIITGFEGKESFLTEECFAPFVGLQKCESLDSFVEMANALPMRLQCALWSSDTISLHSAARQLQYGGVLLNEAPSVRLEPMPYGGMGASGFGREGPDFAIEEFCEKRVVIEKTL